jgi:hypothetical protein
LRKIEEISLSDEHQGFVLKTSDTQSTQDNFKEINIHPRFYRDLRGASTIQILILDTWMKRAPVIKKIEIWGEFSSSNKQEEVEEILRLKNEDVKSLNSQIVKEVQQDSIDESFKIPEDFLDAITQELLTMPYILPSGAVVDETTIEKYKRNEESYGRLPSDPFTGVYFTSDSHPKFDASLKMRLDEFKLRHSHEIDVKNSGRTVGRKEEAPCQPSTSTAVSHISKKIKLSTESSLDELIQSIYKNNQISSFTTPKSSQESSSKACSNCKSASNLYKINTCDHIFCKDCLLKLNSTCTVCKISFENKNVMKIHL